MAEPPSLAGAVHVTVACALPAEAVPMVGIPGTVGAAGVTWFEEPEGELVPMELAAVTVKVYTVPLVRPLTAVDVAVAPAVAVIPPGEEDTVKPVMADPPSLAGAVHVTVACALPAEAVPIVGAPGTVGGSGVTELETAEDGPVPTALVAVTVKVYAVPLASPLTAVEVAVAPALAVMPPGDEVSV
jgi:hypothetical protein